MMLTANDKTGSLNTDGRRNRKPSTSSYEFMWKSLVAGGISGCVAKTVTAPLDRVKILFQGFNPHVKHHAGQPFGVFKAVKQIHLSHGLQGLFQGHHVMLLRIFPSAAIRFMSYEQLKRLIIPVDPDSGKPRRDVSPFRHFLAGSLAGNIAVLSTYPLEIIRSRLAFEIRSHHLLDSQRTPYGIAWTSRQIYQERGLRGFYKGFGATMLGVIPYAGAAFMTYQSLKDQCINNPSWSHWATIKKSSTGPNQEDEERKLKIWVHLLIGGAAGMFGQTVAYPFDTVRHRMQLEGVAAGIPSYKSTRHAMKTIFTHEGIRALFIGLSINYWKTMPANAVAFVVYDLMKNRLGI